jgi:hypothetical protein
MNKIVLIFLISLGLCLASHPQLRSEALFRPSHLIDLIPSQGSFSSFSFLSQASESEYLNEFAQALAEQKGDSFSFIDSYSKSKYNEKILTVGLKFNGNTKLKNIMFNDISGFYFLKEYLKFKSILILLFF